ncbi:MAG: metallophosphoesterase family protein [Deltaproteobacteria bacterium]|nr:metallophosphoesterase family protein [Deltaproteobacteria bacterium]
MRIFAISDVHADYPQNMALIQALCAHGHERDTLLLPGDVTDDLSRLARVLGGVREKFAHVFFVPGNHELWVRRGESGNSVAKFEKILRLCAELGVETKPAKVSRGPADPGAWVVPLFSWYVKPEQGPASLYVPRDGDDAGLSMWADEVLTRWPEGLSVADHFLDMNEPHLGREYDAPVLSFSHFLPRQEVMFRSPTTPPALPARAVRFNFSRVAGCTRIEAQLRALGSVLHVHGHQHRNRDRLIDGVRYVSNCLGYPPERARGEIGESCETLKLLWDTELEGG